MAGKNEPPFDPQNKGKKVSGGTLKEATGCLLSYCRLHKLLDERGLFIY
jgi:hypothetical protein